MAEKNMLIDYNVVSEFAGHQKNRGVELMDATEQIFSKVKEKAMQCAIKGQFVQFDTMDELKGHLATAAQEGHTINIVDENIGG